MDNLKKRTIWTGFRAGIVRKKGVVVSPIPFERSPASTLWPILKNIVQTVAGYVYCTSKHDYENVAPERGPVPK